MYRIFSGLILVSTIVAMDIRSAGGEGASWLVPVATYVDGLSELPKETNRAGILAIAPDGSWLAAGPANSDGALRIYRRDVADGTLVLRFQVKPEDVSGVLAMCFAPDGKSLILCGSRQVVVAGIADDRPEVDFSQRVRSGEGGVPAFRQPSQCCIAPDGRSFYAAEFANQVLLCFSRNLETGKLDFVEALQDDSAEPARPGAPKTAVRIVPGARRTDGVGQILSMAITPDGKQLLAGVLEGHRLAIFDRNLKTGRVSLASTLSREPNRIGNGIRTVKDIAIASDGKYVVTASITGAVSLFTRNNGIPQFEQVHHGDTPGVEEGPSVPNLKVIKDLKNPVAVSFLPNESGLIAASLNDNSLHAFRFDPAIPELKWIGSITEDASGITGLLKVERLAISPDGKFLYVASANATVAVFEIKL